MTQSKQEIPHFYVQTELSIDGLRERIDALNKQAVARVTMTYALARACIESLRHHPRLNSVWRPDGLVEAKSINLGVAVALGDGLVAPAILAADQLSPRELVTALRDLVERARTSHLRPAELSDATFTISNLGMFDVSAFTAIVVPPQVAILAVGRPVNRWSFERGHPVAHPTLTLTLSADHRALDGADAARFLETFKDQVEDPQRLLPEFS
jgi:pyruvate dehydrogenase E2 component (dihydrolipoamide acetyltransferase)